MNASDLLRVVSASTPKLDEPSLSPVGGAADLLGASLASLETSAAVSGSLIAFEVAALTALLLVPVLSSLYAKALAALSLAVAAFFAHACRSVPLMALDAEGAGAARGAEEASDAVLGFSLALVAGVAAVALVRAQGAVREEDEASLARFEEREPPRRAAA